MALCHLDSILAEPVTRLVMLSDGVSEADLLRVLTTARASMTVPALGTPERQRARRSWPARQAMAGLTVERGEHEGMAPFPA